MKAFKKIMALSVACFASLALLGTPGIELHASTVTQTISVQDVTITDSNYTDVLGDGTVSYDPDSNTLTLNNANLSGVDVINCTSVDGSFTVNIPEGTESTITSSTMGIISSCQLNISGAGKLNISADWDPINSSSDISIEDTSLDLSNTLSSRFAIYSDDGAGNGGNISISNSNIKINATDGINTKNGDIDLTNCTLDITTTAETGTGLYCEIGNITVTNCEGTINAQSFGMGVLGHIDISNSDLSIVTPNDGIYVENSSLNVSNTKLNITSGQTGIYCEGNVVIDDGSDVTISVENSGNCVYVEGMFNVLSSTFNFTGKTSSDGVISGSSILISKSTGTINAPRALSSSDATTLEASDLTITSTGSIGINCDSFSMTKGRTEITVSSSSESLSSSETPSLLEGVKLVKGNYNESYCLLYSAHDITWENEDGTVLKTDKNVEFGTLPSYDGSVPTKAETDDYTYTFKAWSPEISKVTGDATYVATFNEVKKEAAPKETTPAETTSTDTTSDSTSSPDTGDNTPIAAVMILLLISAGLGIVITKTKP